MKNLLFLLTIVFFSCNSSSNNDSFEKLIVELDKKNDSARAVLQAKYDSITSSIISVPKDSVITMLERLATTKDEFKKLTFYNNYNNSYFSNAVYIYLVESDDREINGRFKIEYTSEDWLFINKYSFLCDDIVYEYTPKKDIKRDNSGGNIFEYSDEFYSPQINKIVKAIISSKVTKLRCYGDKYYDDRVITKKEKALLAEMCEILNYNEGK